MFLFLLVSYSANSWSGFSLGSMHGIHGTVMKLHENDERGTGPLLGWSMEYTFKIDDSWYWGVDLQFSYLRYLF